MSFFSNCMIMTEILQLHGYNKHTSATLSYDRIWYETMRGHLITVGRHLITMGGHLITMGRTVITMGGHLITTTVDCSMHS